MVTQDVDFVVAAESVDLATRLLEEAGFESERFQWSINFRGFGEERIRVAEYGEWNRKRATLSDVTAEAEYGVDRNFIIKGIRAAKLEYRDGSIWGNPYLRILRSQLEKYIAEELGEDYLVRAKAQTELRKIKKEMSDLNKKLNALQQRKAELEESLKTADHRNG